MNIIDLFAGCGGLSTGFEMAGFNIPLAVEKDEWASETYKTNHPETTVITEDITQVVDLDSLLPQAGLKIEGIIGGPPCQGFSLSGNRDKKDPRNSLFMEFVRFVRHFKPSFFVMENVTGILSMQMKKRKVSFKYLDMDTDKKLYPKTEKNGNVRNYVVSPYQMAAKEGKYYLICNRDHFDAISNYRIDRISQVQILDDKIRPFKELKNANGQDLNLGEYMKEHIYMYSGGETHVRFRVVRRMVTDIVDIFGKDVRFEDETDDYVTVSVNVNEQAMILFAQSYAPDVVILEPQRMVDGMKDWIKKVGKLYK